MLTVTLPAADARILSLADLRLMWPEAADLESDLLDNLIQQASASITGYVGRPLVAEGVQEVIRQSAQTRFLHGASSTIRPIWLSRWPVSVTSVVADGETLVDGTSYECDDATGALYSLSAADEWQPWSARKIVVQYSSGWTQASMPADIQGACAALCQHLYQSQTRDPLLKQQIVLSGLVSESYYEGSAAEQAIPPHIAGRLSRYRDIRS